MRATTILSTTLAVVTLGAVACSIVLWQKYQTALDNNAELQSEVITLRNQAGGGAGAGVLGASASPGLSPGAAASGTRTMLVKDFGIKFQVPADLTDLTYSENPPASGLLQLTTQALAKAYPDCAGAGILGTLLRYPKGQSLPANATTARARKLATAGSYDYYYLPLEKNPCTAKAAIAAVSKSTAEISAALGSITEQ
jgi:hypothetical protein